jgi:putative peptide zinc metalloprotease protein
MTAVHSPRWYRVASLKPRLIAHLQLRRQAVRGQTWYLLHERGGSRSVRLNAAAYAMAGRLDGQHTVQQLWDALLTGQHDAPTQDEVIDLLAQLREAALVQVDQAADLAPQRAHFDPSARPQRRNSLMAWRIRLADPSALLDRLEPLPRLLFTRWALALWLAAMLGLLALAMQHGPTLMSHARQWLATPRYALLALLLYVPIKLLHEGAHALAVRRWGGDVRQAGVTLMLGMPVPWVDASASSAFERGPRLVVGAAGMMVELALAAAALPLWLALPDGLARETAFVTLVITGVSTLLFNANPLQRLDGYYIACDALGLPNLATRSRLWWLDQLRRRLLRLPGVEPMPVAPGETPWLAAYAPLAWGCSLLIAGAAVLWLGHLSLALGFIGGALLGWQMVLRPMVTMLTTLHRNAQAQRDVSRRWQRLAVTAGLALFALLLLPLPQRTRVQGVVWPPDQAQLRADEDGFVQALHVADGQTVRAGDVLLELANPALQTKLVRQSARVSALEAEWVQALPGGARTTGNASGGEGRAGDAQAELAHAQAELERLQERVAALTVRAQVAGRVALPQGTDLPGHYLRRGSLIGQVVGGEPPSVRVAMPQSEAGELRHVARGVSVRLAASPAQAHAAQWLGDGSGAVRQLPSAALSQRHGGPVPTDPQDQNDLTAMQPVVLLDVQLVAGSPAQPPATARLGERAWVRFDAGFSPLAWQLAQGLQRVLQRHFNPQF